MNEEGQNLYQLANNAINREEIKLAKGLENFGDFIMDEMTKIIKSKPLSTSDYKKLLNHFIKAKKIF